MSRLYDLAGPVLSAASALALLVVLVFILVGHFSRYRAVFLYVTWELIATLGFTVADIVYHGSDFQASTAAQRLYAELYWTNDVIVDLLRFVLVIVLIQMTSAGAKRVSGRAMGGIVAGAIILPFILFRLRFVILDVGTWHILFPSALWFQSTSELLNFGAAIMNVLLWAALLSSRKRDPHILMVSLGLGIVVTGTAIAYGARHLIGNREFSAVGYLLMNLTQLLGWLVWCRAFWPSAKRGPVPVASASP